MFSKQELVFAQRFPFSNKARSVLKEFSFDLEKTPESVIKRAALMINAASKSKPYVQDSLQATDLLLHEIQAFPIAKILLSAMDRPDLFDRFAELWAQSAFSYLESADNRRELALELAFDLSVPFELLNGELFAVRIPVSSFLEAGFKEDFMKLVNQPVESGWVFLPENDFCRFLSELARERTRSSLPVALKHVPPLLLSLARQLKEQLVFRFKQSFSFEALGEANPNAFPPCMAKLYNELLEGKNVPHAGRFNIATFLVAVNFPVQNIVELFRKTPNFDEKVTRYQVERIAGKGNPKYSPSSCAKMRSYSLCVANCPVSHPVQFYEREQKKTTEQPKE